MTGRPRMGSTVMVVPRSSMSAWQASMLAPLITMASDPQTPWAHERRNVSVPS